MDSDHDLPPYKRVVVREINLLSDANIGLINEPLIHICDPKYVEEPDASDVERPEPTAEQLSNDVRPILQDGIFCKPISPEQLEKDKQLIVALTKKNIEAYEEFMNSFSVLDSPDQGLNMEPLKIESKETSKKQGSLIRITDYDSETEHPLIVYDQTDDAHHSMISNTGNLKSEEFEQPDKLPVQLPESKFLERTKLESVTGGRNWKSCTNEASVQTTRLVKLAANHGKEIVQVIENSTTTTTTKTVKVLQSENDEPLYEDDEVSKLMCRPEKVSITDDVKYKTQANAPMVEKSTFSEELTGEGQNLMHTEAEHICYCDLCVRHREKPVVSSSLFREKEGSIQIEE